MKEKMNRLRELREQKSRKAHLESLRAELTKQQRELSEQAQKLHGEMLREQQDVDSLQKRGVKSLFYGLTGKKEQKLEQEQREARAAQQKYEAALREQADAEQRLSRTEAELEALLDCAGEYDALLKELLTDMKAMGGSTAANAVEAEQKIEVLNSRMCKIAEAKAIINEALDRMEAVREYLKEAERWAASLQFGNNEASERAMYEALDNARRGMGHLQAELQQLQTEALALNLEADIKYNADIISGFRSRMLSGTAVVQMVKHAHGQNHTTKQSLQAMTDQLESVQRKAEREMNDCCEKLFGSIENGQKGDA